MTWLRIDDAFMRNRKIAGLSLWAFRLHVGGLCYCAANLTDGVLEDRAVRIVCVEIDLKKPKPMLLELGEAELWLPIPGGFLVNDFLEYNPPAAKVKEEREKARERMRRLRSGERAANVPGRTFSTPSRPVKDQRPLGEHGLFALEALRRKAALTGDSAA